MVVYHCSYKNCNSDSRYQDHQHMQGVFFLHFPSKKRQIQKCQRWVNACGRKEFTIDKVSRHTMLCSKHFHRGAGPTNLYPDPTSCTPSEVNWTSTPAAATQEALDTGNASTGNASTGNASTGNASIGNASTGSLITLFKEEVDYEEIDREEVKFEQIDREEIEFEQIDREDIKCEEIDSEDARYEDCNDQVMCNNADHTYGQNGNSEMVSVCNCNEWNEVVVTVCKQFPNLEWSVCFSVNDNAYTFHQIINNVAVKIVKVLPNLNEFDVSILGKPLPLVFVNDLKQRIPEITSKEDIVNVLRIVRSYRLCEGSREISLDKLVSLKKELKCGFCSWMEIVRSLDCQLIVTKGIRCVPCVALRAVLQKREKRQQEPTRRKKKLATMSLDEIRMKWKENYQKFNLLTRENKRLRERITSLVAENVHYSKGMKSKLTQD